MYPSNHQDIEYSNERKKAKVRHVLAIRGALKVTGNECSSSFKCSGVMLCESPKTSQYPQKPRRGDSFQVILQKAVLFTFEFCIYEFRFYLKDHCSSIYRNTSI